MPKLTYRNVLGVYEGDAPGEVIDALYAASRKGRVWSRREWKEWNRDVFREMSDYELPVEDDEKSEKKFLRVLVDLGVVRRERRGEK